LKTALANKNATPAALWRGKNAIFIFFGLPIRLYSTSTPPFSHFSGHGDLQKYAKFAAFPNLWLFVLHS